MKYREFIANKYSKEISNCTDVELYYGLLDYVKEQINGRGYYDGKKKLYYISAEFLIGKLLSNNLINLGLYEEVQTELEQQGKSLATLEEIELEPSLGNGGLGRLSACFLDSIATLGLQGDGVGLNYHLGLFKQKFEDCSQKETVNPWITTDSWLTKSTHTYQVPFKDFTLTSSLYDIDVIGYEGKSNRLRLFDLETVDETIVTEGITFDKSEIEKNLTLFLYPDDSDRKGYLLRIYQQYFMVCNAAQLIIEEAVERGSNLHDLAEYAVIQINDTHPSMVIPEMIRQLMERDIDMEEAITIVSSMCAYTNHTILAEALEKWPMDYLEEVVPHLLPIIKVLDEKVKETYDDETVYIIDEQDRVHMAHMDIHYGYSVNGVAALHTEILMNSELNQFYKIYPEKFNNKTNGITFRRWLLHCNRPLANYLTDLIGDGYKKDALELEHLLEYQDNMEVRNQVLAIKKQSKLKLKDFLLQNTGIEVDENSIFDIQVKRLHEYKRQQMNALYMIHKYLEIKEGKLPTTPITFIFGAKAAPAYTIAKDIIHLILCLSKLVNEDEAVSPYMKIVMVENYNVTAAEHIFPACDISEQISLASKEASGTGNMKFMLNGAVTLGTMDGANVEIADLVGEENIYIFGESSESVIERYETQSYSSFDYYAKDDSIGKLVDFIMSRELIALGNRESLARLHKELIAKDWFMTLLDMKDYIKVKEQAFKDYEDREAWSKKMVINIAKAGYFSADRTIAQYEEDIWHLTKTEDVTGKETEQPVETV